MRVCQYGVSIGMLRRCVDEYVLVAGGGCRVLLPTLVMWVISLGMDADGI